MHVQLDPEADAMYVYVRDPPVHRTQSLDAKRNVDSAEDGSIRGVAFLFVSAGIDLTDVPEREESEATLASFPRLQTA